MPLFVKGWHPENQILGQNCATECQEDLFKTHPIVKRQSQGRRRRKCPM